MKKVIILFNIIVLLASCSTNDGPTYSAKNIGQVSQVQTATILSIEKIHIKGTSETGERVGGLAGGFAGGFAGGGSVLTHIAGAVGGAVIGGIAGGVTQDAITSDTAYQFIVQENDSKPIAVLQTDDNDLKVGDKVTILYSGNSTRIIPMNTSSK